MPAEGVLVTIAGGDGVGHRDGSAEHAMFSHPQQIAISPDGSLIVCDSGEASARTHSSRNPQLVYNCVF